MKTPRLLLLITSLLCIQTAVWAQTQTIRGRVLDKQSKFPLVGATVAVLDTKPLLGAATDADGYFIIENVPLGRHIVRVSYLGYKEQTRPNVVVNAGKQTILNLALEEAITSTDEIVITAEKDKTRTNNEMALLSARGFTIEETSRYAGSRNDPSRMAQNFAGVSGANDSRNDIIIRGNSPTGLLWRLEGVDIPNPSHFGALGTTGGPVSMLNYNTLSNSDFLTGAFPAEYGNGISGVFDLQMRTGNNAKREYMAQLGFNGLELGAEGPFSKKSKTTYLVNYRYSTLAVFDALGISFGTGTAIPNYQDLSFKVDVPTKNAGRFSVFGVGGFSNIDLLASKTEFDPNDLFSQSANDIRQKTSMGVVGLTHLYFFNKNTYSQLNLAVSRSTEGTTIDSIYRNPNTKVVEALVYRGTRDFRQVKYTLREQINKKLNARNNVNIGVILDWYQLTMVDSFLVDGGSRFRRLRDFNGGSGLLRGYAQWQHRFNDQFTLNAGVHYQQFLLNNTYAIEPRLGLKYSFTPTQSVSIGAGLHSQLQPLQVYFRQEDGTGIRTNRDLEFTKSRHLVLAYDNSLTPNLRLKVEGYYQQLVDVPVDADYPHFSLANAGAGFGIPTLDNMTNGGTGRNYGVELTLEKFYSKGYYFLFTGSLFESKYKGYDGIERNTAFNGNFVTNGLLGKEWRVGKRNTLAIDLKVTYAGGRRFIPIDLEASRQQNDEVLLYDQAYEQKLDDYFRFDFKIGFKMNGKRITQEWFIDIQNVTNQQNVFTRSYNTTANDIQTTYQLGLFPLVQWRLLF
ncbi:TonB-dependent receptor [Microscilla marina]|uniref:TonB-dependent receptor plug domain protein n=1 Tax=Microscilla marina ATCC 23134 TaxID=313606 RepID=A1ZYT8_MICM2|nr:TonB-dependent receptor [Microscilla marina]EAY24435.1 TonB-dependent receptor plug domain protein [Microscilla marina ATCC 23134]